MTTPLDPALRDALAPPVFTGVAVAWDEDRFRLRHAAGVADPASRREVDVDTRFPVASVSKFFTATLVLRLVDAGRWRLEDPVARYLPPVSFEVPAHVTLEALLAHRSGCGDYLDDNDPLPFEGLDVDALDTVAAFVPLLADTPWHPPGTFRYSSAGFALLGLAIEHVTGDAYPDVLAREVLDPAGLTRTGFPPMDDLPPDAAIGVLPDGRTNVGHLPRRGGPDGGIVTTVDDLLRLFRAIRSGALLASVTRDRMWTATTTHESGGGYGLGVDLLRIDGETWFGHTGSDPGLSARVMASTARDRAIVVMASRDDVAFPAFRAVRSWFEGGGPGTG